MRRRHGELFDWERVVLGTLASAGATYFASGLVVAMVWAIRQPGVLPAQGAVAVYVGLLACAAFGLNPLNRRGRAIALAVAAAGGLGAAVVFGPWQSRPANIVLWFPGVVVLAALVCFVPRGRG